MVMVNMLIMKDKRHCEGDSPKQSRKASLNPSKGGKQSTISGIADNVLLQTFPPSGGLGDCFAPFAMTAKAGTGTIPKSTAAFPQKHGGF